MGKYENMIKCAQIRSLTNQKEYENAYDMVKTLDIEQINVISDLNTISDVYIQMQEYEKARDVYLKLYDRMDSRRVLYQLVYLSIKCEELEEAEEYFDEYQDMDKSVDRIILRYYIDKAKGADRKTLIEHLKQLKGEEYIEEWAYELAKLYHKEGMKQECVEECSDIILWFGEGIIVEKAMLLRHHYIDGVDISSEKAILRQAKNLSTELKIATAIAERNEKKQALENKIKVNKRREVEEEQEKQSLEEIYESNKTKALEELHQALKRLADETDFVPLAFEKKEEVKRKESKNNKNK